MRYPLVNNGTKLSLGVEYKPTHPGDVDRHLKPNMMRTTMVKSVRFW